MKKKNNRSIAVRETAADRVFNIINITLLALIALIVLYPLYFVLCASFTDPMVVNRGGLLLYPVEWYTKGYQKIFAFKQLWSGYYNSMVYMVLGTTVNMVITIPCAYAVSRKDFVGRGILLKVFAFTMFFSGG